MTDVAITECVKGVLGEALQLGGRIDSFAPETALFGSVPEFDSMAVVTVITALEERFGFVVNDDELTAEIFATVGSLSDFVSRKLDNA